jgi:phosphoribosyl 1,2-cyclic phosphodiesterase
MELKILGSSSKGNGYVLEADNEALIIEAGVKLLEAKKAVGFNISKVVGCIVTHQHNDHAGYVQEYAKAGVVVLALSSVIESKKLVRNYKTIEIGKGYMLGNFKVLPFEVMHDVPCVGYLIEHPECGKVLFVTDTYAMQYRFTGVTHWLIEANYADDILTDNILEGRIPQAMRRRLLTSHMELNNTKEVLISSDLSKTRNIVLIHLSDGNSDERRFIAECKAATGKCVVAANAGMVINFDVIPL